MIIVSNVEAPFRGCRKRLRTLTMRILPEFVNDRHVPLTGGGPVHV